MYSKIFSAQVSVSNPFVVEVELNVKKGTPQLTVVGLPDKAVDESKDRVSSALENADFQHSDDFKTIRSAFAKITISLAPADKPKTGSLFDLPIALAYLHSVGELQELPQDALFVGELSLDGRLKSINGALTVSKLAQDQGFKRVFVPKHNAAEAALVDTVQVFAIDNIEELIDFLRGEKEMFPVKHNDKQHKKYTPRMLLDDIKGQDAAKRALTIAAAGGHNIALFGPPGTGKSMLAKVFTEILPDLDKEASLEVTAIHSAAGVLRETIINRPPLRSPHHSASYVSIVGGGAKIKPGEITLAHKGVLFLDEFPEFDKRVINALREPLEEKQVTVSRATGSSVFPADFILIAALNPCPCGYLGTNKCVCSASAIQKYQQKLSGPIQDRIDIWVEVNQVEYEKLLTDEDRGASEHNNAVKAVKRARESQKKRFMGNTLNAHMSAPAINKYIKLDDEQRRLLNTAAEKMALSGRAFHKVIKVARTIADLDGRDNISQEDILEALNYREKSF